MSSQDALERIVAALHEAAFDDSGWPAEAALIDDACRTKGNRLVFCIQSFGGELESGLTRFCYRGERRRDLERDYFLVYHPTDERTPRLLELPDSQLVRVADLYSEQEKRTSRAYNEWLSEGEAQNGLITRMDGPNDSFIVWSTADPLREDWSSDQIRMVGRLLPHIRQFVRVWHALAEAGALGTSLAGLLNHTRIGVVLLDRQGRIAAANDRARDVLRQGDGLSEQDGFLRTRVPAERSELQRLLARAAPRFGERGEGGSMTVSRAPGSQRLALQVAPVEDREAEYRAVRAAALVLVVDPERRERIDRSLVAAALGLTRAESEVAVSLAEGWTIRKFAVATGRSEETVRWHLKQVFNKLGVSRQIEVARLVLALAGLPSLKR